MRLSDIDPSVLRLLNDALAGQLAPVLAAAASASADMELRAIRDRADPSAASRWTLVVAAGAFQRHLVMDKAIAAIGVVAHVYLADVIADLKTDLALLVRDAGVSEVLDGHIIWSRNRCRDVS